MRALSVTAIALLLGAVVSFFVARALGRGGEPVQTASVVVASAAVEPGTRLTALRVHADFMRVRRMQQAEELAAKIPLKILFPLILLIFPSLLVVILGPAMIRLPQFLGSS